MLGQGCSIIEAASGRVLWQSILPGFLPNQRWFAAKGQRIASVSLADAAEYRSGGFDFLIAYIDATIEGVACNVIFCRSPSPGKRRATTH